MRVELDETTQVLRTDDEGFEALVGASADPASDRYSVELAAPGVAAAMSAIASPLVQLRVDVAGRSATQTHRGWLDLETAALLLAVRGEERQLLTTSPDHVAAAVARVVRLGPRKVGARDAVPVEPDVLEDLFHADDLRRGSAFTVAGADLAWTLTVGWAGGERLMSVVDGPQGLHLVTPGDHGGWSLSPVDATLVWRRLTTMLPGDDELAAPA